MKAMIVATFVAFLGTGLAGATSTNPGSREQTDPAVMNQHFKKARDEYQSKNYKVAATEIRAGESIVRNEAKAASGTEHDDLTASAGDLHQLATDVEKGQVQSVDRLNQEFARADNRLAKHYQTLASQSWQQKESSRTASALNTAAAYFESAASWTGEKASEAVHGARTASGKLMEGAGWVPKEIGDAIAGLGKGIQSLGEKLEPGSSATAGARNAPPPAAHDMPPEDR